MVQRKRTTQNPLLRSSSIDRNSITSTHDRVVVEDEGRIDLPEEDFADTATEFSEESFATHGGARLNFEEPLVRDGKLIAQVDREEVEVEASFWQSTMVCVVLGANPPLAVFEGFINRLWGKLGIERIARMNAGHTLAKFRDEATRDMVLESGVVHFDRKPVLLRPRSTNLDKMRLVKSVPVWIRLPDLGLQYWGLKSLSALVSTIGKPMMVDKVTREKSMVKFARVLVDVEISDQVPQCIKFIIERGQLMEQAIEYEWLPTRCSCCKNLGHTATSCRFSKETVWKPKQKVGGPFNEKTEGSFERGEISVMPGVKEQSNVGGGKAVQQDFKGEPPADMGDRQGGTLHKDTTEVVLGSSKGQEMHCSTPKKVGGTKHIIPTAMTLKANKYSLLQENRTERLQKSLGAFLETKLKRNKIEEMMSNVFLGWNWYSDMEVEGRILLVWKEDVVSLTITQSQDQLINCEVKIKGVRQKFCLSFVYGRNTMEERKGLWALLTSSQQVEMPWLVVGDFNAVFEFDDRIGGRPVTELKVEDSRLWKANALLSEINPKGSHFIWSNKQREGSRIFSKLDRCFVNEKWIDSLPDSEHAPESRVLQQEEQEAHDDFVSKSKMYESFLRQKRKINWLRFGDENTAYFHASLKQRRIRNRITYFLNEEGVMIDNNEEVVAHFFNHFKSFLGKEQQLNLIYPFSKKDVKRALFSIPLIKSPGPDGFGSRFYKALWKDLGDDISEAILQFFEHGEIPAELNNTILSLIPKVVSPKSTIDYRPIACCNTLYKCISKMLCFRLAKVLPLLIHQNQGAFIKNRQLAHNILILQDLLHGYTRKTITPRCLIKIDLSKAYDSIDWVFLEDILAAFCFPSRFIQWILVCLTDTSYSLLMNGRLQGNFAGRKGLRQGDPISPLLFVLVMEYLTRLLNQTAQHREFRFHPMCKNLQLVNLCFADDLILLCKGTFKSVKLLMEGFLSFSQCSRLSANRTKSHIYFGGVVADVKNNILSSMVIEEGHFPLKYLGVNLKPARWQVADCSEIIKKLQARLHVWASRHLSFAGRTQLIFSVLLGIRNYWMQIFMLPISVIQEIDRICRNFLWGANGHCSKFHCSSWSQVCLPKSLGVLGFKEGSKWNKVLLAKFIWAVSSKQNILWVKWIDSIYLRGHSFWSYHLKPDVSWYWRKLCYLREDCSESKVLNSVMHGKLNLKSLYLNWLQRAPVAFAKAVWSRITVPKHRFILWQSVLGHLLTKDNLIKCQISVNSSLYLVCERAEESHHHLFFDCSFSHQVWELTKYWLGSAIWSKTFVQWKLWLEGKPKNLVHHIAIASLAAAVYGIWCNRNACYFSHCSSTPLCLVKMIRLSLKTRFFGCLSHKCLAKNRAIAKLVRSL
ncbi:uncharacterized protein LOC133829254 [Humulus lupulus]|uniref:uncharacterized protein LOC133829254 n=1 Tax=Humulus lupulus TaxID=3486 RepID=UPI002B40B4C3|nr:uncharacterized protein LOC133829254 [Humulus lupulus]